MKLGIIFVLCVVSLAIELPAGLRPAKALGETQRPIIPSDDPVVSANVRTPPNLSLRSRMIASLNSNDEPSSVPSVSTSENNDSDSQTTLAAQKPPVIFQKSGRKAKKPSSPPASVQHVSAAAVETAAPKKPERVVVAPPEGKNYGVNTLLQTNLVDSKGRVIKGVSSVPIRVPSSGELRNAKTSRASASQVENDAEKVVPIQFGRADRHRY